VVVDLRCGTECARLRLCSDGGERVRDYGDEQVDEPKIEHDKTNDEKEARYEELRVDHGIHQRRPLQQGNEGRQQSGPHDKVIAHRIGGRDDEHLQRRVVDGIKAFKVTHRIASFLNATQLFNLTVPTEREITDPADLAKGTDITLHGPISPVLGDVRIDGECGRVNVSPTKMAERRFGLTEGCLQVTRPAQGAVKRLNSDDPATYKLSIRS
jgi:hypothetical protein